MVLFCLQWKVLTSIEMLKTGTGLRCESVCIATNAKSTGVGPRLLDAFALAVCMCVCVGVGGAEGVD